MDNFDDEYKNYWETNMFLQSEELDSYLDEAAISGYYDSSSPDGTQSSILMASKNIVSERNRRKKLNERLYALRSVVPNITKMDKASIVKDAIEYIQSLHDEEKRIEAEILELESGIRPSDNGAVFEYGDHNNNNQKKQANKKAVKRTKMDNNNCYDSGGSGLVIASPIQVLELRVTNMGDRTIVVSLTSCNRRRETMVKLCEMFESLTLKIITANITAFSGKLFITIFLEGDEEEKERLRLKIEDAIATLNGPDSPMSI